MSRNKLPSMGILCVLVMSSFLSCSNGESSLVTTHTNNSKRVHDTCHSVMRLDTLGLIVLYPEFGSVDLVCGAEPSEQDTSVILFAEAAYTQVCTNNFTHNNIAGDHVSTGKRYGGYKCTRNTGAFVFYRFCVNLGGFCVNLGDRHVLACSCMAHQSV